MRRADALQFRCNTQRFRRFECTKEDRREQQASRQDGMRRNHHGAHRPSADTKRLPDLTNIVCEGRDEAKHDNRRQKDNKGQMQTLQCSQQVLNTRRECEHHHHIHHGDATQKRNEERLDGETAQLRRPERNKPSEPG